MFSALSPYFLNVDTLSDATFNFTERAIVALPLALLIIAGEIDISVAAIIALVVRRDGPRIGGTASGPPASSASGSGTGLAAGCINGALVTMGRVPSIVATIGTMTLFRGAAYAVLGDRVLKDYPESFATFGQGYLVGPVSIELALFVAVRNIVRRVPASHALGPGDLRDRRESGGEPVCGPRRESISIRAVRADGLFSGLAAVLLTSRLGSTRPSIAQGWELEIISMVILGGVSVWGGKGSILASCSRRWYSAS